MEKWSISNVIEILKSPKLVCWVAVTCLFLLFIPSEWVPGVLLEAFRKKYGLLIVFPLFGSAAMIFIFFFQWVFKKLERKRKLKTRIKYLQRLTNQEKKVLRGFIDGNTKTQELSIMDGVVKGLEFAGVIYRATSLGSAADASFDFNIQPWAWHYLIKNSHILEI